MNYHNLTYPDQNNGDGLRVVLWLSGCSHHCFNCQNPQTWDENSGIEFDIEAKKELFDELSKDYISGITFSGGDPLHENNIIEVKTWDENSGIEFDIEAKKELFDELSKDYISGITFSGGDPLHENNIIEVNNIIQEIKKQFPNKTIWLYTGYTWEELFPTVIPTVTLDCLDIDIIEVNNIIQEIKKQFPNKTIWLYTGYTWEELFPTVIPTVTLDCLDIDRFVRQQIIKFVRQQIIKSCNVVIDGPYIDDLRDITLKWRGSSNQRVIDVQKTLQNGEIVLWTD